MSLATSVNPSTHKRPPTAEPSMSAPTVSTPSTSSAAPAPGAASAAAAASNGAHAKFSIATRGLNLWYGTFQALKNVDVQVSQGKITGLIGPSGCGKTTLLRCFNRINERYGNVTTTGEITILGKNIYDPDVSLLELRKAVGMVFQRPNPLPISIYDNVLFGNRIHTQRGKLGRSDRDALVEQALKDVFLWKDVKDRLKKKATGLTLEQQQKLCIARLLPLKPRVILMDEPCSALDAEGTAAIESLLDGLREKYTIVIVTHNMAQARRASDECIYMLMGELIEHGKTLDVFLNPKRKETEMYIEGRYG
jgi:phosphate transport system ATP-binding protein